MNTVIFDMDGLMFDTERVFVLAWDYAGEKIGIGKAGYMVHKTLGMNTAASEKIWQKEFGDSYNQSELKRYTKDFFTQYYAKNTIPVKKGLYVLLEYLKEKNYKLAVASSSPKWEIENHLKESGVYQYFSAIVSGDMVTKSKPEPDIYLKACELVGEKPENCYALEDSQSGLLAAYMAGCKPIMIPDLWQPDKEIENILFAKFDDLAQVKEFLENQFTYRRTD